MYQWAEVTDSIAFFLMQFLYRPITKQQSLEETGQVRGYDYADYSTQQSSIPGAVYSGGAMTGPVQLPDSSAAPQIIEFHNYIDLDGQIIAENTTQYQNNEQTRSNGY